jgi:hypothetical protein
VSRWYEKANEASFKPVDGGYVFQKPNPWVFARPSYYLVNDSTKTEIMAHLGRWRLMLLLTPAVSIAIVMFTNFAPKSVWKSLIPAFVYMGPTLFSVTLFAVLMLVLAPLIALPHIYLARALRPLLIDAPRTQMRISLAEQLPRIATSVSPKLLLIGLISALVMVVCGGFELLAAWFEEGFTNAVVLTASFLITGGALLALYFSYLVRLKRMMQLA